jgi:hypothetical protein
MPCHRIPERRRTPSPTYRAPLPQPADDFGPRRPSDPASHVRRDRIGDGLESAAVFCCEAFFAGGMTVALTRRIQHA